MRLRSIVIVESRWIRGVVLIVLTTVACVRDDDRHDSATIEEQESRASTHPRGESRCYRSPESVLLGPDIGQRNVGHAPGWIRLDSLGHGSRGPAQLVDANHALLGGRWEERGPDSLRVVAGNDFLRTTFDVLIADDTLRGRATAHSDADLERDSVGKLGEVRRAWELNAVGAPCDSMTRPWVPGDS